MNKQEFLAQLRRSLSELPPKEADERITFYSEMIDDRIEEGLSEEEAVAAVGSVDEITRQLGLDSPSPTGARRKLSTWEIVLLVVGSPVWLSLGVAALAVIASAYVVLWAGVISLWAVLGSLIVCCLCAWVSAVVHICFGRISQATAMLGAGILCVGLAIFLHYGCKYATKGVVLLTKNTALWIKNRFVKKEEVQCQNG